MQALLKKNNDRFGLPDPDNLGVGKVLVRFLLRVFRFTTFLSSVTQERKKERKKEETLNFFAILYLGNQLTDRADFFYG